MTNTDHGLAHPSKYYRFRLFREGIFLSVKVWGIEDRPGQRGAEVVLTGYC